MRIDEADFADNEVLREAIEGAERVHLIGLASDGGVHSSDRHLVPADRLPRRATSTTSSSTPSPTAATSRPRRPATSCERLDDVRARVGSVIGRYFAMDRDKRWDRIEKAVELLRDGEAEHHADSARAGGARRLRP